MAYFVEENKHFISSILQTSSRDLWLIQKSISYKTLKMYGMDFTIISLNKEKGK